MKIGCVGDVHLGAGVAKYGPERLEDQAQALKDAFALFDDQGCDLVLIAGDTFDGPLVPPEQYQAFYSALRTNVYVVVINGNGRHDLATRKPNALAVVETMDLDGMVDVHCSPAVHRYPGKVQLCTLPWAPVSEYVAKKGGDRSRDSVNEEVAELLLTIAHDLYWQCDPGPKILLGHWALAGTALPSGVPVDMAHEPILDTEAFADIGFDTLVFGHIHKPQVFADGAGFYVGSPLPLNHGEAGVDHGCWVWDSEDGPTFHPLESRRFVTLDFNADGTMPPHESVAGAIVRARFTMTEKVAATFDAAEYRRSLHDSGAFHVSIEPTIVREAQARIAVSDDTDDLEAFDEYLEAEVVATEADRGGFVSTLRERHRSYVERVPE